MSDGCRPARYPEARFAGPRSRTRPAGSAALTVLAAGAVALALAAGHLRPSLLHVVPPDVVAASRAAEDTMRRAALLVRDARRTERIPSEAGDDRPGSSFIGGELTSITTTLGSLEAKRVATSDKWASALTVRLYHAGLRRGDFVAAGMSGSFPGLNVALVAACQSLGLELAAVSSVTASSFGANQPGFTWPEIEARLVKAGVIRQATVALTLGGAGDRALDLEQDGRTEVERIARTVAVELEVPVLAPRGFEDAVAARMETYRRSAHGRPVALYANVGGTEASMGRSAAVLRLRNGFLPGVPFDFSRERGVMGRYAERGVPVLTLLNVRDLALRWNIL